MAKKTVDKAILPINHARITAGYKNEAYHKKMGFRHFGSDFTDAKKRDRRVYAPCAMKIIACGNDPFMGGSVIAVSVNEVDVHYGPKIGSHRLTFRFAHMDKVYVRPGQVVRPEDREIGLYGGTGRFGGGRFARHLHVEVSTDVDYPIYSPTLSRSSTIWKAGPVDASVNPMDVFKVDAKGAHGGEQSFGYRTASGDWVTKDDKETLDLDGKLVEAKPLK